MSLNGAWPGNRIVLNISAGSAAGATGALVDFGFCPNALTVNWQTTGAPSAIVGGQLQYSYDGVTWLNLDAAQTGANNTKTYNQSIATTPLPVCRKWRFTYTSITGGTSPTLTAWLGATQ